MYNEILQYNWLSYSISLRNVKLPATASYCCWDSRVPNTVLLAQLKDKVKKWSDTGEEKRLQGLTNTSQPDDVPHHKPRKRNPNRFRILQDSLQSSELDGLNTATYKLNYIKKYPLFTYMSIDVGDPPLSQVIYNENDDEFEY